MTLHTVHADSVAPQAWRNGGGQTRALLTWPRADHWSLRISRADIASDGPFSEFAGVQRWFAVLHGAGVRLRFAHTSTLLREGDAPLQFDGANAPVCELIDGPTQDLNLMVRGGRGVVHAVRTGCAWTTEHAVRAVYAVVSGTWSDGQHTQALAAHTLLWSDTPTHQPWTFSPSAAPNIASTGDAAPAPPTAFWLGFTPDTTP